MSSDAQAIIENVLALAEPTKVDPEAHYVATVPAGHTPVRLDPVPERHLSAPRRPRGITTVYDVDSLAPLWGKYHSAGGSELYGDPVKFEFVAVLNADIDDVHAGFRDHRVEYPLRHTLAWERWLAMDGKMVSQVEFAEFIEARLRDIVSPTGADMLELASTLEASSTVEFKSAVALSSGVRTLNYEETQTAKAGQTGQLQIPKQIELGLAPFEGGDPFKVTARFRHRIRNGSLALGVVLDRPEEVVEAAFEAFSEMVAAACDTVVLLGTPPGPVN